METRTPASNSIARTKSPNRALHGQGRSQGHAPHPRPRTFSNAPSWRKSALRLRKMPACGRNFLSSLPPGAACLQTPGGRTVAGPGSAASRVRSPCPPNPPRTRKPPEQKALIRQARRDFKIQTQGRVVKSMLSMSRKTTLRGLRPREGEPEHVAKWARQADRRKGQSPCRYRERAVANHADGHF